MNDVPGEARPRRWPQALAVAVPFGLVAAVLTFVSGQWALDRFGPTPTDGNFVLDTPGVYDEPGDDSLANPDLTGQSLPAVSLVDTDGNLTTLAITKPTIINLWFSTCAACERELPDFAVIDSEMGDRIDVIGIDPFDTVDAMTRFATDHGVGYRLLRDPEREFTNALGVTAFPVTLFVDADGVVERQLGEVDADDLRAAIDEVFPVALASDRDDIDDIDDIDDKVGDD